MPGTIVIQRGSVGKLGSYKVSIDGQTGEKIKGGFSTDLAVESGVHQVRISAGGYRTNTVTVEVTEGRRHYLNIDTTGYASLLRVPLLGVLPALVPLMWPGLAVRLRSPQN